MGRAVAGAIDQGQDLAGVGQGEQQGVVAPGAIVGDVHAPLAGAGGLHQGTVHVHAGFLEEGFRLLIPNAQAGVIAEVEQDINVRGREAPAEVAGGGGVGEALRPQGVEEDFVLPPEFQGLQAGAATEGVIGDGQDVIGFVVGQVHLEQV